MLKIEFCNLIKKKINIYRNIYGLIIKYYMYMKYM